ncbi:MAG: hydrogenase maturation nickel metallochaperone HypA [Alphaproteobacteria bacterium]|nr:hydrogenase maturation nickel metallochaperone HypA [Alphaproteobacteria bacterium]MCB9929695.1 hydrogenase maturation nickel metallochaperone HypA [Alphaproteobacteria bacterium]
MHEAGLMRDLMRKILDLAAANRARRVSGVTVWLGALSHMSPGHFQEHFDQAAAGTLAEGARLTCQTSDDMADPNAQSILLRSIETED